MEQQHYSHPPQEQLRHPFRISNRGFDQIDRFLTFNQKLHPIENKHLAQFSNKIQTANQANQFWTVEIDQATRLYTIRHDEKFNKSNKSLYLTLTNKKQGNDHIVELAPLQEGENRKRQLWSYEIGENLRYMVKIETAHGPLYLQSTEAEHLEKGYETVFLCKPKAEQARRYLQFWKFSPKETAPAPSLPFNMEQILKNCLQSELGFFKRFKGKIYSKRHAQYSEKIQQYATSSYPQAQMSPHYIAYPVDHEDVSQIIKHAASLNKKVVARSGGHSYSGLSSGGDDTIVLSMDQFNTLQLNKDGLVQIGPCVRLRTFSKQFKKWGISIPHGQCPFVNVGGHAQTGGYGHFIHSFGLCLDYVQAFDIVLASGQHRRIHRPQQNCVAQNPEEALDIEIFRGVLGGNAGSFGIVTRYLFRGIKDQDHPQSYGFSRVRLYTKELFHQTMKIVQEWTRKVQSHDEQIKGLDLMLSVGQIYIDFFGQRKQPILLLEGLYSDLDKNVPYNNQFEAILDKFNNGSSFIERGLNLFLKRFEGKISLSDIAERYVRKFPFVTFAGREFDLPYVKRTNITYNSLTDQFVNEFVDQVTEVADPKAKHMTVVVQMAFGGGASKQKGKRMANGLTMTSIPQRDLIYNFVFDIFYNEKQKANAKEEAIQRQDRMQVTVDKHFNSKIGEKRFFWACFDDIDMRKPEVIKMYYDNEEQYRELQKLKAKIDPTDIFHTPITVKLPQ